MFLIWGTKGYVKLLGFVTLACRQCSTPAAHRVEQVQRKFTLFFIPLVPYSTKTFMTCTFCGISSELSAEEAERLTAQSPNQAVGAGAWPPNVGGNTVVPPPPSAPVAPNPPVEPYRASPSPADSYPPPSFPPPQ